MNRFIFDGYYDNILESFGWHPIHLGVPKDILLTDEFYKSKFVVEHSGTIPQANSLAGPSFLTSDSFASHK